MTASSESVNEGSSEEVETVRVQIWSDDQDANNNAADDVITATPGEAVLWRDAVENTSNSVKIAVHPDDTPATVEVYTSESLHPATETFEQGRVNGEYWDGPLEYGLTYTTDEEPQPVTVEVSEQVLFLVTKPPRLQ